MKLKNIYLQVALAHSCMRKGVILIPHQEEPRVESEKSLGKLIDSLLYYTAFPPIQGSDTDIASEMKRWNGDWRNTEIKLKKKREK